MKNKTSDRRILTKVMQHQTCDKNHVTNDPCCMSFVTCFKKQNVTNNLIFQKTNILMFTPFPKIAHLGPYKKSEKVCSSSGSICCSGAPPWPEAVNFLDQETPSPSSESCKNSTTCERKRLHGQVVDLEIFVGFLLFGYGREGKMCVFLLFRFSQSWRLFFFFFKT